MKIYHDIKWTRNKGMLPLYHYRNADPQKYSGWLKNPLL